MSFCPWRQRLGSSSGGRGDMLAVLDRGSVIEGCGRASLLVADDFEAKTFSFWRCKRVVRAYTKPVALEIGKTPIPVASIFQVDRERVLARNDASVIDLKRTVLPEISLFVGAIEDGRAVESVRNLYEPKRSA